MTDEACGLRERKKRETRRAINRAALDLVEEKGFDAVTTEEIAARAGVSARTFFNYFPSKEAAVIGTTAAELERMRAQLGEVRDDESSSTPSGPSSPACSPRPRYDRGAPGAAPSRAARRAGPRVRPSSATTSAPRTS